MAPFGSLLKRVAVAVPGMGLFVFVALLDSTPVTAGFTALLALLCGVEAVGLLDPGAGKHLKLAGGLLAAGSTLSVILLPQTLSMPLLLLPGVILALWWMATDGIGNASGRMAGSFGAMTIIAIGFGLLARFRLDQDTPWVFFVPLFICWAGDSAAYFAGTAFGRHRLAPAVSPAKSWEGFFAGIAGSIVGALAAGTLGAGYPVMLMVAAGVVGGTAGVAGDLIESALKRSAGVKDSGSLLPGHGGILDRFDSILAAVPAVWFILAVLGPGSSV